MKRSILIALVTALALSLGAGAATAAGDGGAQTAAKPAAKKKAGKKKAKCKANKKKAKGKAKARTSLAAAQSAAKKGKAKGKKKAKRKCGKAKPKRKAAPRKRSSDRRAERRADRMRERREAMERHRQSRPKPPTLQDVAPADGSYTAASAPGLTVTISGNSTQARVTYTLAKTAFSGGAACQSKDVAIDVSGALALSTGKAHLMADATDPNGDRRSVSGTLSSDGSFQLSVVASYEEPPGAGSFCSGNVLLKGTLVKQ